MSAAGESRQLVMRDVLVRDDLVPMDADSASWRSCKAYPANQFPLAYHQQPTGGIGQQNPLHVSYSKVDNALSWVVSRHRAITDGGRVLNPERRTAASPSFLVEGEEVHVNTKR